MSCKDHCWGIVMETHIRTALGIRSSLLTNSDGIVPDMPSRIPRTVAAEGHPEMRDFAREGVDSQKTHDENFQNWLQDSCPWPLSQAAGSEVQKPNYRRKGLPTPILRTLILPTTHELPIWGFTTITVPFQGLLGCGIQYIGVDLSTPQNA